MANTYDFTVASQGGANPPWDRSNDMFILKKRLDVSSALITSTLGADDTYQMFDIPADTYVLACWLNVITPETTNAATATMSIGVPSETAAYLTLTTLATAGAVGELKAGTAAYHALAGRFYGSGATESDTVAERVISCTVAAAAFTELVVDVYALCFRMDG
jgi:hypothetical protein